MKNLLSVLAVSTLVGTSASNLKLLFTNSVVSHGLKSISINNMNISNNPFISEFKDLQNKKIAKIKIAPNGTIYAGSSAIGLWKSIDGINFNQVSTISNRCVIKSIDISSNGEIWVGTDEYLYFLNDNGISFNSMGNDKIQNVTTIAIAPNGNIFVGAALSYKGIGLYKSNDGTNFTNIYPNKNINSIAIAPNGTIYVGIEKEGQHDSGLLDKLKTDTINWVNSNMKDINIAYQNAIKNAESDLNLHGYSIDTLLNGKSKPQTKTEIDNFADGKSYHDWLQSQANMKYKGWQLAMGFGIGIPLLLIAVVVGWIIRRKTDPRYNGITRAKKETKIRFSNFRKSIKNEK